MEERRKNRSSSRPQAVQKQLEAVARENGACILAITGTDGAIVGRAGDCDPTEEAVLAGVGARAIDLRTQLRESGGLPVKGLRLDCGEDVRVACRFLEFRGAEIVAVGRSRHRPIDEAGMERVATGIARILEAKELQSRMEADLDAGLDAASARKRLRNRRTR